MEAPDKAKVRLIVSAGVPACPLLFLPSEVFLLQPDGQKMCSCEWRYIKDEIWGGDPPGLQQVIINAVSYSVFVQKHPHSCRYYERGWKSSRGICMSVCMCVFSPHTHTNYRSMPHWKGLASRAKCFKAEKAKTKHITPDETYSTWASLHLWKLSQSAAKHFHTFSRNDQVLTLSSVRLT